MAEQLIPRTTTAEGRVRLFLAYDDVTGMTTAFVLEADPGLGGSAVFHMVIPPNFDQTRSFKVEASGNIQGRDRINIPSNRRWNLALDPVTKLPTADDPVGVSDTLDWDPD